jgi:hypothetical protein
MGEYMEEFAVWLFLALKFYIIICLLPRPVYIWKIHKYASPEKTAYFESQKRKSSDVIFHDATSRIHFVSLFHLQWFAKLLAVS